LLHNARIHGAWMIVDCPHCSSRYRLPESLLGPAGARVRCPRCNRAFAVDAAGVILSGAAEPAPPPVPGATVTAAVPAAVSPEPVIILQSPESPDAIAGALLDGLIARSGDPLRAARDRGTLFAEWGPVLLGLCDEYRRRAGDAPGYGPLRRALRERLGIELPELPTTSA
jgi:predicted Zn finger-like uncharacterized protein